MGNPSDPGDGGSRPGTLDDGFNVIAKDLDRAFCLGLSANQAVIMNSVREQSWTAALVARRKGEPRPDPRPARVNLTRLADGAGLNRSRLSTALKGLVSGGILAHAGDGYLIKKDYSKWLDDDGKGRRFILSQISYIRAAKGRVKPLQIADNNIPLPLQNATPEAELIDEISNGLLLQNATVGPETTVAKCNSDDPVLLQNATPTVAKRNSDRCKLQQCDTVLERAAEDLIQIKEDVLCDQPESSVPPSGTNLREPEDKADVQAAINLLASDARTERLAIDLGRVHNSELNIKLEGWRWLVGACRIASKSAPAKYGLAYLRATACNASAEELAEVRADLDRTRQATPGKTGTKSTTTYHVAGEHSLRRRVPKSTDPQE